MLLPLYALVCVGYVISAIIGTCCEVRENTTDQEEVLHPSVKYLLAGMVPVGVSVTMVYLFWIVGGATTMQFNVGSSSAMDVWSTWVDLFPVFLLLTAANSFAGLIWLVVCVCSKKFRQIWPVAISCLLLSAFGFLTVMSYFPSA